MRFTRAFALRSLAAGLLAAALTVPASAGQPRPATILELAAQQKNLTTFVAAVHTAGLDDQLRGAGPLTVYAPTDDAFARLPAAQREALLADPARLKNVLLGHVVTEKIVMNDGERMVSSGSIASAAGRDLVFGMDGERATVSDAHLVRADMQADNGSINTIDRVLLP